MADLLGSIRMVAFNYAPVGFNLCDGTTLLIVEHPDLFKLLGTAWGGDGKGTFALPDLRSRVPVGQGAAPGLTPFSVGNTGGNEVQALTSDNLPIHSHLTAGMKVPIPVNNAGVGSVAGTQNNYLAVNTALDNVYGTPANGKMTNSASVMTLPPAGTSNFPIPVGIRNAYVGINYLICTDGPSPSADHMDDYFLGEIILTAFNWTMQDFLPCNGQQLSKSMYLPLFTLIGYTFGGSGDVFNLPDMASVQAVGMGQGTGLQNIALGAKGGGNTTTLQNNNLPAHVHAFTMKIACTSGTASSNNPASAFPASITSSQDACYTNLPADGYLGGFKPIVNCATTSVGNGAPLDIENPVLALNYLICNNGLYPQRS